MDGQPSTRAQRNTRRQSVHGCTRSQINKATCQRGSCPIATMRSSATHDRTAAVQAGQYTVINVCLRTSAAGSTSAGAQCCQLAGRRVKRTEEKRKGTSICERAAFAQSAGMPSESRGTFAVPRILIGHCTWRARPWGGGNQRHWRTQSPGAALRHGRARGCTRSADTGVGAATASPTYHGATGRGGAGPLRFRLRWSATPAG